MNEAGVGNERHLRRRQNRDQIPDPPNILWRDIGNLSHRHRGTVKLNYELYSGRLIWNRLRCVKDPSSGKRVARQNDHSEWITTEVPDLRLIDAL